jgi:hypothetical protein
MANIHQNMLSTRGQKKLPSIFGVSKALYDMYV